MDCNQNEYGEIHSHTKKKNWWFNISLAYKAMCDKSSVRSRNYVKVKFVTHWLAVMIKQIRSQSHLLWCHVSDPVIQYHVCKNCLTFIIYGTKLTVFGLKFDCSHRKNSTLGLLIKLNLGFNLKSINIIGYQLTSCRQDNLCQTWSCGPQIK